MCWSCDDDDGHPLRMVLNCDIGGQRKKGRPRQTLKKQVDEERIKVGLHMEDALH